MRIISALVIAVMVLLLVSPQVAFAAEVQDANETKTNLKIKDSGVEKNIVSFENKYDSLEAYDSNDFKSALSGGAMSPEREAVLAKYKTNFNSLPQGKFTINASAYTAAADECGKSDGITASGLKVKENETLACPRNFPFGTILKIEGMGTYVCQDRGGAIKGNHIDIYMETKTEAFAFGRQNLIAEVIK